MAASVGTIVLFVGHSVRRKKILLFFAHATAKGIFCGCYYAVLSTTKAETF